MPRDTAQTAQVVSRAGEVQNVATVEQASARQETSYRHPLDSGTRHYQVTRNARGCDTLGNAKSESIWHFNTSVTGFSTRDLARVRGLQTFEDVMRDRLYCECVVLELLGVRCTRV